VDDKLEITLRITLDRKGVEQESGRPLENNKAFFVLGLVHALLTDHFGDANCRVEMESGTGLSPALVRAMNSFAPRHKRALEVLDAAGEVMVEDRDVLEVLQTMHDVMITPLGAKWRVVRMAGAKGATPGDGAKN